jgi:hypothetical protein
MANPLFLGQCADLSVNLASPVSHKSILFTIIYLKDTTSFVWYWLGIAVTVIVAYALPMIQKPPGKLIINTTPAK